MKNHPYPLPSPAQQIAIRSGALKECVYHGELSKSGDVSDALALIDKAFGSEFIGVFESKDAMQHAVLHAINSAAYECPACRARLDAEYSETSFIDHRINFA